MSFESILPFLRPIESLLLDDSVSEIMGNLTACGGMNGAENFALHQRFASR